MTAEGFSATCQIVAIDPTREFSELRDHSQICNGAVRSRSQFARFVQAR
jgi:hypothetical protein